MEPLRVGDFVKSKTDACQIYRISALTQTDVECKAECKRVGHDVSWSAKIAEFLRIKRSSDAPKADTLRTADLIHYQADLPILWRIRGIVSLSGIAVGLICCGLALSDSTKERALAITAVWALGPPLWFIVEYCFLCQWWGNPRNKDDLKHGQSLAKDFWIGVAAMLAVIYKLA